MATTHPHISLALTIVISGSTGREHLGAVVTRILLTARCPRPPPAGTCFRAAGTPGVQCPANSYCPAGGTAPTPCPANTAAPPGAADVTACAAVAGYYAAPPGCRPRPAAPDVGLRPAPVPIAATSPPRCWRLNRGWLFRLHDKRSPPPPPQARPACSAPPTPTARPAALPRRRARPTPRRRPGPRTRAAAPPWRATTPRPRVRPLQRAWSAYRVLMGADG